jgi:5'(3')-deoxyribonucleotidase
MTPRILLDLDGVLADFVGGVCRLWDISYAELVANWGDDYDICVPLGITTDELWRRIDAAGESFWAELEPYPWAYDLFAACCELAPTTILTSPSWHPSSLAGKLKWMNRHLSEADVFRRYLIGPTKEACAHRNAILIDDRPENCDTFKRHGGHAVLFPAPWNDHRGCVDPLRHTLMATTEFITRQRFASMMRGGQSG